MDRPISLMTPSSQPTTGTVIPGSDAGSSYGYNLLSIATLFNNSSQISRNVTGHFIVSGDILSSGDLTVSGNTFLGRNNRDRVVIQGNVQQSGNLLISGQVGISGDLRVSGSTFLGSGSESQTYISGRLLLSGPILVAGNITGLQSIIIGGGLNVNGETRLAQGGNTVYVGNDIIVSGRETILDYLAVKNGLVVSGDITGTANINVRGSVNSLGVMQVGTGGASDYLSVSGILNVSSTGNFRKSIFVQENLAVTGNFGVTGNSVLGDAAHSVVVPGPFQAHSQSDFATGVSISGNLNVIGFINANHDIVANDGLRIRNNLFASGETNLGSSAGNNVHTRGTVNVGANLNVTGDVNILGNLNVIGSQSNGKVVKFRSGPTFVKTTTIHPTSSSNIVTMTFAVAPGVTVGEKIWITGDTHPSNYNGSYYVESVGSTTLTYHASGSIGASAAANMTLGTAIPTGGSRGIYGVAYHLLAGQYTVHFSSPFPSNNFIVSLSCANPLISSSRYGMIANVSDTDPNLADRKKLYFSDAGADNPFYPTEAHFKAEWIQPE